MADIDREFVKYLVGSYNDRSRIVSQKEAYYTVCLKEFGASSFEARESRNDLLKEKAGLKAIRTILDHLSMCYQIKFEYTPFDRECEVGPVAFWLVTVKED